MTYHRERFPRKSTFQLKLVDCFSLFSWCTFGISYQLSSSTSYKANFKTSVSVALFDFTYSLIRSILHDNSASRRTKPFAHSQRKSDLTYTSPWKIVLKKLYLKNNWELVKFGLTEAGANKDLVIRKTSAPSYHCSFAPLINWLTMIYYGKVNWRNEWLPIHIKLFVYRFLLSICFETPKWS